MNKKTVAGNAVASESGNSQGVLKRYFGIDVPDDKIVGDAKERKIYGYTVDDNSAMLLNGLEGRKHYSGDEPEFQTPRAMFLFKLCGIIMDATLKLGKDDYIQDFGTENYVQKIGKADIEEAGEVAIKGKVLFFARENIKPSVPSFRSGKRDDVAVVSCVATDNQSRVWINNLFCISLKRDDVAQTLECQMHCDFFTAQDIETLLDDCIRTIISLVYQDADEVLNGYIKRFPKLTTVLN